MNIIKTFLIKWAIFEIGLDESYNYPSLMIFDVKYLNPYYLVLKSKMCELKDEKIRR